MKDRNIGLFFLTYLWVFAVLLLGGLFGTISASCRTGLLLSAFLPVVVVHLWNTFHFPQSTTERRTLFMILGLLWAAKLVFLVVNDGIGAFYNFSIYALDWLDLLLTPLLAFMVSLSFFMKTPFFYVQGQGKYMTIVAVVGFLIFLWQSAVVVAFLVYGFQPWIHPIQGQSLSVSICHANT